jgi:hypothetical protein
MYKIGLDMNSEARMLNNCVGFRSPKEPLIELVVCK